MAWFTEMASIMGETDEYRETLDSELESDTSQHSQSTNSDIYTNIMSPPQASSSTVQSEGEQSRSSEHSGIGTKRKKPKKQEDSAVVAQALTRLENISSQINLRNEEDEFHFFGLSVAAQLRQIPLYEALGVQSEIQNILTLARRRNIYPNLTTVTDSTRPNSNTQTNIQTNTQTNTLSASNIEDITYSTPSASNTQTNTLLGSNIEDITYSTPPASNTQNVTHASTVESQHFKINLLSEAWKLCNDYN